MSVVTDITDDTLDFFVSSNETVILDIWAPWCGPCKAISPLLDQLAADHPTIRVAKLNADESNMLAKLGVRGVPTLIKYVNGTEVARRSGATTRAQLEEFAVSGQ